jgi:hypothetical protein
MERGQNVFVEAGGCREIAADTTATHDRIDNPDKGDNEGLDKIWVGRKVREEVPSRMSPVCRDKDLLESAGGQKSYPCCDGRVSKRKLLEEPDEEGLSGAGGRKLDIQLDVQRAAQSVEGPETTNPNPE